MKKDRMQQRTLTEAEAEKLGLNYQHLFEQATAQLLEYRMWLRGVVTQPHLHPQIDEVRLEMVQLEPAMKDAGGAAGPTISVVYDFPDGLFVWLKHNQPRALDGGWVLKEQPRVVKGPVL